MLASELPPLFVRAFALLFGAAWGSFFNVAIYRWPREMSVVTPASHCPACGEPIRAIHNVPVVSYVVLRGRAACCGAKISPRYPVVEALSAALCLAIAERWIVEAHVTTSAAAAAGEALALFAMAGGLVIATFVDLDRMEIPDEVSLPGAALGLATASLRASPGAEAAALGAGGGFLLVQLLFVWGYERLTGRRGMGEGDAKLLMMIGAFLGWQGALFALVAGALQGVATVTVLLATGRDLGGSGDGDEDEDEEKDEGDDEKKEPAAGAEAVASAEAVAAADADADADAAADAAEDEGVGKLRVPFGPFLAVGALEFLFFGDRLIELYMSWAGL